MARYVDSEGHVWLTGKEQIDSLVAELTDTDRREKYWNDLLNSYHPNENFTKFDRIGDILGIKPSCEKADATKNKPTASKIRPNMERSVFARPTYPASDEVQGHRVHAADDIIAPPRKIARIAKVAAGVAVVSITTICAVALYCKKR